MKTKSNNLLESILIKLINGLMDDDLNRMITNHRITKSLVKYLHELPINEEKKAFIDNCGRKHFRSWDE